MADGPFVDRTFQLLDELEALEDRGALLERLAEVLRPFGLTGFVLASLPAAAGEAPLILLNGWPPGWHERYVEAGHHRHDPCARLCRTGTRAFTWDEIPENAWQDPGAARLRGEAAEHGFRQGLCVPIHTPFGYRGLSMAGGRVELPPGARRMATLLATAACTAVDRILQAEGPTGTRLTAREREVLRWIAIGRTVPDVAEILALSSHTVGEHLKNIRRKLGAGNNTHAVVEALRRAEIRL